MKGSLFTHLNKEDQLVNLRNSFDDYLKETYPHITIAQQIRHWGRFINYLKKERKAGNDRNDRSSSSR